MRHVVAKPTSRRTIRIELGQRNLEYFASPAINQQPSASFPSPARILVGQGVIQAEDALYNERVVGHLMRQARCDLFALAVHQQRPDLQIRSRALVFAYHPLDRRPLAEGNHVLFGSRQPDSTQQQNA